MVDLREEMNAPKDGANSGENDGGEGSGGLSGRHDGGTTIRTAWKESGILEGCKVLQLDVVMPESCAGTARSSWTTTC